MAVNFDLARAHPEFRRIIPAILLPLAEHYPGAKLNAVGLYEPKDGDTSMGATYFDGRIQLNLYWFGRAPSELSAAAGCHAVVNVGGVPIGWHGPMMWEPSQVLTHEFGHCIWNGLPQDRVEDWATPRWREATRRPHTAPSGYALASPPEFYAEMFALCELGLATADEVRDLRELTEELR